MCGGGAKWEKAEWRRHFSVVASDAREKGEKDGGFVAAGASRRQSRGEERSNEPKQKRNVKYIRSKKSPEKTKLMIVKKNATFANERNIKGLPLLYNKL